MNPSTPVQTPPQSQSKGNSTELTCMSCFTKTMSPSTVCALCGANLTPIILQISRRDFDQLKQPAICEACGSTNNLVEKTHKEVSDTNPLTPTVSTYQWHSYLCNDCQEISESIAKAAVEAKPKNKMHKRLSTINMILVLGVAPALLITAAITKNSEICCWFGTPLFIVFIVLAFITQQQEANYVHGVVLPELVKKYSHPYQSTLFDANLAFIIFKCYCRNYGEALLAANPDIVKLISK